MKKFETTSQVNFSSEYILQTLPELEKLKTVFEHNAWHEETTYEHIENIIKAFESWSSSLKEHGARQHLNTRITKYRRLELFPLIIWLHDFAKKDTFTKRPDGTTTFPNHEDISADQASTLLHQFPLSEQEKSYVVKIIRHHSLPHIVLSDKTNFQAKLLELEKSYPDIYIDLLSFGMLDTQGSKLSQKNPEEYEWRIKQYEKCLNK